ncbi:unnamed protein product [Chilo suppressalis]|uniref:C-type lectin domain-containing protein n=1 Tax=Chilo suppressalis TaxID=168631 RepID=A0ABN8ATT8_CHISP|nr:unnamed protein product [Chilo suppressalis]
MGRLSIREVVFQTLLWMAATQNIFLIHSAFRPDYTYYPEAGGWFKIHKVPTDWNEARLKCYFEGANLASPINDRVYAAMRSLMLVQSGPAFTGVHMLDAVGEFTSIEGVQLQRMPIQWAKGEPNNLNNEERSLAILPDGSFADVQSNKVLPYICYRKQTGNEIMSKECGSYAEGYEWDPVSNSCYKYHHDCVKWHRANMICAAEGAHLLILNSEREAKLIVDRYAKRPINCNPNSVNFGSTFFLVGIHNIDVERSFWFTVDGQRIEDSGYHRWASGEPNILSEKCGAFRRDNSGLFDIQCEERVPFICEISDPKNVFGRIDN